MRKRGAWTTLFALLAIGSMSIITNMSDIVANANSAQTYWEGVSATGTIVTDENCPLEVQNEKLTFDLREFPQIYYTEKEEFLAYTGKVTAQYTFYNPADYTVKATLAFPFGRVPYYADIYDEEKQKYDYAADTEKYDVTVNGEAVEKKLRYTLSSYYGGFVLEEDLPRLQNGYVSDGFYSPSLTVTKYTYKASGLSKEHSSYAAFSYSSDGSKTRIWLSSDGGFDYEDVSVSLGEWVSEGELITLYAFGEPLSDELDWKIYENAAKKKESDGRIELLGTQSLTFEEFAFSSYFGEYSQENGISEVDWYNAVVCSMNVDADKEFGVIYYNHWTPESQFMRWYQYEIEVPPKSTIVNEVTAPIYPSVDEDYEPAVYGYTYLLSPAKSWSKFGTLDIEINTPYYLIDDESGFTKTETGYALSLDGLPDGELEFELSTSEEPEIKYDFYRSCGYVFLYGALLPVSCVGAVIEGASCSSMLIGGCGLFAPLVVSAIALFIKKRK